MAATLPPETLALLISRHLQVPLPPAVCDALAALPAPRGLQHRVVALADFMGITDYGWVIDALAPGNGIRRPALLRHVTAAGWGQALTAAPSALLATEFAPILAVLLDAIDPVAAAAELDDATLAELLHALPAEVRLQLLTRVVPHLAGGATRATAPTARQALVS